MTFDLGNIDTEALPDDKPTSAFNPLSASMSEALRSDPATEARRQRLAQQTGMPVSLVQNNDPELEWRAKLNDIDLQQLPDKSPQTAKFLSNIENAVIAQNDVTPMQKIEEVMGSVARTFEGTGESVALSFESIGKSLKLGAIELAPNRVEDFISPSMRLFIGDDKLADEVGKSIAGDFGIESNEQLEQIKTTGIESILSEIRAIGDKQKDLVPDDLNLLQQGVRAGWESILTMAPAVVVGVGTTVATGGGATGPVLATLYSQTMADSYGRARAEGLDSTRAFAKANIDATIEVVTERLPVGELGKIVTGKEGLSKDAVKRFLIQDFTGEQIATIGQSINDYGFGLDEEMKQAIDDQDFSKAAEIQLHRQAVTAIATVFASGAQAGAAASVNKTVAAFQQNSEQKIKAGEIDQENLDRLNHFAQKTDMMDLDRQKFKQFVEATDGDNNTTAFLDLEQAELYFQSKTPDEVNDDPALKLIRDAIAEAKRQGDSDAQISIGDMAENILGTEHYDALKSHMTLDPEGVTPAKAEGQRAEVQRYTDELIAQGQANADRLVESQEVYSKVKEQLVNTGFVTPRNASVMAEIVPAWATAYAERNDVSIQEAYENSGLTIEGTRQTTLSPEMLQQRNARGFFDPQNSIIRMTEASDLSTFLHEYGHFMLEMEYRADTEVKGKINQWFSRNAMDVSTEAYGYLKEQGIDKNVTEENVNAFLNEGTTGDQNLDNSIGRAVHEQFARGFEKYLMEGKAPSIELRNAFRTFARWLTNIYQAIRGNLNVKLDDDIRSVYDRLLATEEQIAAAEARAQYEPLFKEQGDLTEEQFENYKKQMQKVKDKQSETLRDKLITEMTRQRKQWWTAELNDEIANQKQILANEDVYAARRALRRADIKLDRGVVRDLVGEEVTDKTGKTFTRIPATMRGMTSKPGEEGIHPDMAAAGLNYESGAQMVQEVANAPSIDDVARTNAENVLVDKYGDIMNDGSIELEADQAIRNEERGKLLLAELKALSPRGRTAITREMLKADARERIENLTFRQIHPSKYRRAELRAAQEAATATLAGDMETARQAKLKQLLNFYLGNEAMNARNRTLKIVDDMARYNKAKVQNEIRKAGNGYWEQIENILHRFEFRKSATIASVQRINESIDLWARKRRDEEGDGLIIANSVINTYHVTHWKELTFGDLQGVADTVNNIEHVAKEGNKVQLENERLEFEELVQRWTTQIEQNPDVFTPSRQSVNEKDKRWLAKSMAQMTKVPFLASWLDGGERAGLSHDIMVQPFINAYAKEQELWQKAGEPIRQAILNRSKEDKKRHSQKIYIPELEGTGWNPHLTGDQVLAFALNTGNEGNLRKLILGENLANKENPDDITIDNPRVQAVLSHMTESDWKLVQLIWDQMETLYPELSEVHRQTTGETPPKVQATPVKTPFGTFRGGYYPVKYDAERSTKSQLQEEQLAAQVDSMFSSVGSIQASVTASATSERTGYYAPIKLSLDVVGEHFQEVTHFIAFHRPVRQMNKLLRNKQVLDTMKTKVGPEEVAQLRPWLNDIAKDGRDSPAKTYIGDMMRRLRFGVTLGVMGFRATSILAQLAGISNTAGEVGSRYTFQAMKEVYSEYPTSTVNEDMPPIMKFAMNNSKVLPFRANTMDREIRSAMAQLANQKGILPAIQETSMKGIAFVQLYAIDLPSWRAAYNKSLDEHGDQDRAIRYADWVVENVQGSGATHNLATIMRNQDEVSRTLTMFMTFFSSLWNLNRDVARGARQGFYSPTTTAAKMFFFIILAVIIDKAIRGELFGTEDEEPEEVLQKHLIDTALYPVASIPVVRDFASGVFGEYGYNFSPVASVLETGTRSLPSIAEGIFTDEEISKAQAKGATKFAGAALGIPGVSQAWATGEQVYEIMEQGEVETMREVWGLVVGPQRE